MLKMLSSRWRARRPLAAFWMGAALALGAVALVMGEEEGDFNHPIDFVHNFLYVASAGPGVWSLDTLMRRRHPANPRS